MRRVLFVCVHNAGRSQMAEAFFNRFARDRGIDVVAESAGTAPGDRINPVAAEAMAELGVSLEGQQPLQLTPERAARADPDLLRLAVARCRAGSRRQSDAGTGWRA